MEGVSAVQISMSPSSNRGTGEPTKTGSDIRVGAMAREELGVEGKKDSA